ncbi:MAG: lysine transporter LysE [Flavobacteriales bacterium]|nr:lysine transporter LysE [Flavobacteriia bacterium]NCP05836.1 lysine transporter LysE [Flavobacteriales bacterium]PIY12480.1 MAG: lysine transporter LysE [Flavobacteriaceae bacterium CG_4_10_14_3_um_filter_33_47]PJB19764.1 MAG: lysine transporter LysE [Flavobacteriaceae bacterium CG_4_9_14_3_um_filter_33_16]NCP51386.1 lysine transporter LysE [Flavobacteriales bacterium]
MNITFIFFLGLIVALIGVIPPGLLNMTAAKISLKEGHARGIMFSIGVCFIVFVQTYIAAIFARYLSNHAEVIDVLQRVAFVIFVLITIYYLFIAKKQTKTHIQPQIRSKHSRFFQGVFLSSINVFPIPFQAYITITLASFGWLDFSTTSIISYVSGAGMGTFVMLYVYIFFFDKIKNDAITSQKSMNFIIGIITGVISIVTLVNIIKEL